MSLLFLLHPDSVLSVYSILCSQNCKIYFLIPFLILLVQLLNTKDLGNLFKPTYLPTPLHPTPGHKATMRVLHSCLSVPAFFAVPQVRLAFSSSAVIVLLHVILGLPLVRISMWCASKCNFMNVFCWHPKDLTQPYHR